jgi:hypothetical protein
MGKGVLITTTEKEPFRNESGTSFGIPVSSKNNKLYGGGGEIRTHGRVAPTTIFKTVAFNRSATPPLSREQTTNRKQGNERTGTQKNLMNIIPKTLFDFLGRIHVN